MPAAIAVRRFPYPAGRWIAWYSVGVCLLLYLIAQIDRQVISLLVGPIQQTMGIGDFKVGLLMGPAFGLCYAISALPLAWAADRSSRRWVVVGGVITWALAACASGLARNYGELFVARMLVGVGEAALLPSAYVLVTQLVPQARLATALSVLSMGSVGGLALAFGLGGWLSGLADGLTQVPLLGWLEPWRLLFILTGTPGLVLAWLILTVPDSGQNRSRQALREDGESLRSFLTCHRIMVSCVTLGWACVALASSALAAWMPTFIIRKFGWSAAQAGTAAGLLVLVLGSIAKIGSGVIVDRRVAAGRSAAHLSYLMLASLLAIPTTALAFFVPSAWLFLACISSYFLLPYSNMGYGSAFVQLLSPAHLRARTSALFLFFLNLLAAGVGAALVGWLSENVFRGPTGLGISLAVVICSSLTIAAVALAYAAPQAQRALANVASTTTSVA